jgi:hypothetical protein
MAAPPDIGRGSHFSISDLISDKYSALRVLFTQSKERLDDDSWSEECVDRAVEHDH